MELPSAKGLKVHQHISIVMEFIIEFELDNLQRPEMSNQKSSANVSRVVYFFFSILVRSYFLISIGVVGFEKFSTFLNNFPQIGKWKQLLRNEKKPEPSNPTSSVSHFFYFYSLLQIKRVDSRLNDQAVLKKLASLEASWSISISTPCGSVPGPGPVLKNSN